MTPIVWCLERNSWHFYVKNYYETFLLKRISIHYIERREYGIQKDIYSSILICLGKLYVLNLTIKWGKVQQLCSLISQLAILETLDQKLISLNSEFLFSTEIKYYLNLHFLMLFSGSDIEIPTPPPPFLIKRREKYEIHIEC